MKFYRLEYWSRQPFPSPEDLPDPGTEPGSPALKADSLLSKPENTAPVQSWGNHQTTQNWGCDIVRNIFVSVPFPATQFLKPLKSLTWCVFLYANEMTGSWRFLDIFRMEARCQGYQLYTCRIRTFSSTPWPLERQEVLEAELITSKQWFNQLCLFIIVRPP